MVEELELGSSLVAVDIRFEDLEERSAGVAVDSEDSGKRHSEGVGEQVFEFQLVKDLCKGRYSASFQSERWDWRHLETLSGGSSRHSLALGLVDLDVSYRLKVHYSPVGAEEGSRTCCYRLESWESS